MPENRLRRFTAFTLVPAVFLTVCIALSSGCTGFNFFSKAILNEYRQEFSTVYSSHLTDRVEILRDRWGIPHVFAENEDDLYFATGFIHAHDRYFQMDLLRRMARGRLAELLGNLPIDDEFGVGIKTILDQDRFQRILGFDYFSRLVYAAMDDESRRFMEKYTEGINAYVERLEGNVPVEYRLIDSEVELWDPVDTIAIARFLAWGLSGNAIQELIRYEVVNHHGEEWGRKLFSSEPDPGPYIIPRSVRDYRKMIPSVQVNDHLARRELPHPAVDDRMPTAIQRPDEELRSTCRKRPGDTGTCDRTQPREERVALEGAVSRASFCDVIGMLLSDVAGKVLNPAASNNWVVGGSMTRSGMPILANDPHLPHMTPSIFYLIHLSGAGYDVIGSSLPGLPAVLMGHNRHLAWGITNNFGDIQDVFVERPDPEDPERYIFRGESVPFLTRTETIVSRKRFDADTIRVQARMTRHGTIVNDALPCLDEGIPPLALRWSTFDISEDPEDFVRVIYAPNPAAKIREIREREDVILRNEIDAFRMLAMGKDISDFRRAMAMIGSPVENFVAADDRGNIAYASSGLVPIRAGGDGNVPARGWDGTGEWIAFIPPDEMPQVYNPARDYMISANNKVVPAGDYPYQYSNAYMTSYRAWRIEDLLLDACAAGNGLTAADMLRIQLDDYMIQAEYAVPLFVDAFRASTLREDGELAEAVERLESWDYRTDRESTAASIFHVAYYHAFRRILEDDLGPELLYIYGHSVTEVLPFDKLFRNQDPDIYDDLRTPERETPVQILALSLRDAVRELRDRYGKNMDDWGWGKLHMVRFDHPLGMVPIVSDIFNIEPAPHLGSRGTVWASFFTLGDDSYGTFAGPIYRHVIDMGDVIGSRIVLDTGQSGHPGDPHYDDLNRLWREGETVPALMDRELIEEELESEIILLPGKPSRTVAIADEES